jgi:PhnB protein
LGAQHVRVEGSSTRDRLGCAQRLVRARFQCGLAPWSYLEQKKGVAMRSSYKPQAYSTVSPYLIVDGASRTIDFLVQVFDAVELRRFPDPTGKLMHAEVRIDDTVVMLADGGPDWPSLPANVHVYVTDVDATYRRALDAGATSVQAPVQKDDADKRGGVKEAGGTTWWIATKVE